MSFNFRLFAAAATAATSAAAATAATTPAAESTTARAAGIAIVFNVAAGAARSPSHVCTSYR